MTIVRSKTVTLPQTDDGRFLAQKYKEDMESEGLYVKVEHTTISITVTGFSTVDIPDDYVQRLKEAE